MNIGLIGLDTSHSEIFTRLLNDSSDPHHVKGARITHVIPTFSKDLPISTDRFPQYFELVTTKYGVVPVDDADEFMNLVDAVIIGTVEETFGLTYIFIAHDLSVVKHVSDRIGVMYLGKIVELSDKKLLFQHPLHPYTQALMSAVPSLDPDVKKERIILSGDVPSPSNPPNGCAFHTRCKFRKAVCESVIPREIQVSEGRFVRCHMYDEEYSKEFK